MSLFDPHSIPTVFLSHAADILTTGLSGSDIVRYFAAYAIDFDVNIPHAQVPLAAPNKRTAMRENLAAFSPQQQYKIIKDLCELDRFSQNSHVKDLKIKLISRYSQFAGDNPGTEINESLIEETTHWLENYPASLKLYNDALTKFQNDVFTRNLLDDLRLALELLLQTTFKNEKSLENQIGVLGEHLKAKGGSKELTSMFLKLVEYYTKYHNSYIKHDDAVIEEEIEFIFEITSSFMKHIIRLA